MVLNYVNAAPLTTVINTVMSTNNSAKEDGSLPTGIGVIVGGVVGGIVMLLSVVFAWLQCRSGKCKCFKPFKTEFERLELVSGLSYTYNVVVCLFVSNIPRWWN
jgi:hypothetical protein